MRGRHERQEDEPAFVLHTYPYRETSIIVEALTATRGRVALVARGARRPRSDLRGVLQSFQPLTLSWTGAGELKTLARADWRGGLPLVTGSALLCGFYLNELLLKLVPREDAHPRLFENYETALRELASGAEQAPVLRRFELRLLAELGYAMSLTHEADTGRPIDPDARYHYAFERGGARAALSGGAWSNTARLGAARLQRARGSRGSEATDARGARLLSRAPRDCQPPSSARSAGAGGGGR